MCRSTTKPKNKWPVHPAKTQIGMGIRTDWSESSLSAWRNDETMDHWLPIERTAKTLMQTAGRMPRLIWVFAGRICEPRHDKTNKVTVRPAKTQISLGIRPVWSESSLCAQWVAKDPSFLHADSEDSDQTGRMLRLIWIFAGRTVTLLVLSCRGSCHFDLSLRWTHM